MNAATENLILEWAPPPMLPEAIDMFMELAALPRHVGYVAVWNPKRKKFDKVPHDGANKLSTTNPAHWGPMLEVAQAATGCGLSGVGLVLTDGIEVDGETLVGFDFDDVSGPIALLEALDTYSEISPSRTGKRAFVWVPSESLAGYRDNTEARPGGCDHCEIYFGAAARFLTLTFHPDGPVKSIAHLTRDHPAITELQGLLKPKEDDSEAPAPFITGDGSVIDLDALLSVEGFDPRGEYRKLLDGAGQPEINRNAVVNSLLRKLIDFKDKSGIPFSQEDIFATLTQRPVLWLYLLDHRNNNPEKAMQFANTELATAFSQSVTGKLAKMFANPLWKVVDIVEEVKEPDLDTYQSEYYIASFAERRKNRKPNRWQVKGRFRKGTINIIFGASGTYKSTTMTGLGVSIQCLPYWHDSLIENGGEGVLIIAAEDDEGVVDMVEAACIEYGIEPDKVSVYITHGGYDLTNPEVIKGIKATIAAMPVPLSAIIVDTLNRNCGGLDENSASDMRTFLNRLDELRGDATVYVIHHNGHGDKKRERGSYAIRCNADSSVLCEYNEDTKLFTMEWEKLRSAPTPKPLTLKPKSIVIRQEADSSGELEDVTAVCMVMAGEAHRNARVDEFFRKYPELGAGKRRSYLWTLMARILNKPGETQTALAALCGVSQPTIHDTLIALQSRGLVTTKDEALQLTKAGVEAMNELSLDVTVALKAQGLDIQYSARETPAKASEDERNALLS